MKVLVRACGALSLAAAMLHAGLVDEHLDEWWGYGLFFILASIAQAVYGLVLCALPMRPAWEAEAWRAFRVRLYAAGIVGNVLVVLLYAATRTVGVPVGPDAGDLEPVGLLGLATKALELLTVAGLAILLRGAKAEGHVNPSTVA